MIATIFYMLVPLAVVFSAGWIVGKMAGFSDQNLMLIAILLFAILGLYSWKHLNRGGRDAHPRNL